MVEQLPSLELVVIIVCILLSAFFSSSETALTALSEREARQMHDSDERRYRALTLWIKFPNRVLTTILIGNNVVNIFSAALAASIAQRILKNQAIAAATAVMTILILVFGEIAPKTFAKHNYRRFAPFAIKILKPMYFMVFPVTVALTKISKAMVRVFGQEVSRTGPFVTPEDITYLIDLGHREGVIEKDEEQLLHSVIEFGDTLVREIMVPRTEMVAVDSSIERDELVQVTSEAGHSRIPVFKESIDNIIGVFYAKDLIKAPISGSKPFQLSAHFRKPFFVPEVMHISNLLKEFQRRQTHLAIVVDEYGGTSGLVTLEDVLEEIVGEIQDEYDDEERQFRILPGGKILADGRISVYDLGEKLDVEFPESNEYEKLGGFLTMVAGRLPAPGTRLSSNGFDFIIKEADERRISRVEIERSTTTQSDGAEDNGKTAS
jgi:CBS domain containing-hemolysin-like protein